MIGTVRTFDLPVLDLIESRMRRSSPSIRQRHSMPASISNSSAITRR
jgi:hypothetical protein